MKHNIYKGQFWCSQRKAFFSWNEFKALKDEEFEMQCREIYKDDSMPSEKTLADVIRKELIKMGKITQSEQI